MLDNRNTNCLGFHFINMDSFNCSNWIWGSEKMRETKEEVEELEKRLKENPFKPIDSPLKKLARRFKK